MIQGIALLILPCTFALTDVAYSKQPDGHRWLIEQALDEPTAITLTNVRLGNAIAAISEQSGVTIVMPESAMSLVPYGPDTVIKEVDLRNITLRQGLNELFGPLGMTFVVHDRDIEIVPRKALTCLGRPPSWQELELLSDLTASAPGTNSADLERLKSLTQFRVPVPDAWRILEGAIRNIGAGSGDDVLTIACENLGWAWCLAEGAIGIETIEQQFRRQLDKPVNLLLRGRPLLDVLRAVGEAVHVPVHLEQGTLPALPRNVRESFAVNIQRQSALQAFEQIAAYTGLGFLITTDGVLFFPAGASPIGQPPEPLPGGPAPKDPYIAKILVPLPDGRKMEWLVRWSELPEDLRAMRQEDLKEAFQAVRARGGG